MTDWDDDPNVELDEVSADDPIGRLVGDSVVTVPPDASARKVAQRLNDADVGLVIVGDARQVEVVISERDIVRAVSAGIDLDATPGAEIGNRELRWIPATAGVADAIEEMMTGYHRHLLVRGDDGRLAGVLSIRDLLAAYPG